MENYLTELELLVVHLAVELVESNFRFCSWPVADCSDRHSSWRFRCLTFFTTHLNVFLFVFEELPLEFFDRVIVELQKVICERLTEIITNVDVRMMVNHRSH